MDLRLLYFEMMKKNLSRMWKNVSKKSKWDWLRFSCTVWWWTVKWIETISKNTINNKSQKCAITATAVTTAKMHRAKEWSQQLNTKHEKIEQIQVNLCYFIPFIIIFLVVLLLLLLPLVVVKKHRFVRKFQWASAHVFFVFFFFLDKRCGE